MPKNKKCPDCNKDVGAAFSFCPHCGRDFITNTPGTGPIDGFSVLTETGKIPSWPCEADYKKRIEEMPIEIRKAWLDGDPIYFDHKHIASPSADKRIVGWGGGRTGGKTLSYTLAFLAEHNPELALLYYYSLYGYPEGARFLVSSDYPGEEDQHFDNLLDASKEAASIEKRLFNDDGKKDCKISISLVIDIRQGKTNL